MILMFAAMKISIAQSITFGLVLMTSSNWGFAGVIFEYFWIELGLGSVLDVLVLKNDAECTSQYVKRRSGGRVLIFSFFLFFE